MLIHRCSQHWGLVVKDAAGTADLLDINDVGGSWAREVRDFDAIRKNHLKALCEIANLEEADDENDDDEAAWLVRNVAAAEEVPASRNGSGLCRTWVLNVLKSLQGRGVKLYGEPGTWRERLGLAVLMIDKEGVMEKGLI